MMLLALDTATATGWAAGAPGERPVFGTRHFVVKDGTGEIVTLFRAWLEARCDQFRPKLIVFESPYVPRPGARQLTTVQVIRRLLALAGQVEGVAWERGIRCAEVSASEVAKFFLGTAAHKREIKKRLTIETCQLLGFDVGNDDNAADALAIWCMAEAKINPEAAVMRAAGLPLFLNSKTVAPRRRSPARRGDVGRENGDPGAQQRESFIGSAA